MSDATVFHCDAPGENSEANAVDGPLVPGNQVSINGADNTKLGSYIEWNDGGRVHHIALQRNAGFYNYQIQVIAEGPHGITGGGGHIHFTDQTGDTYRLYVYSSRPELHTLSYDSERPGIVKIGWNN